MPDSIQDITFQPKTEGFSYSNKSNNSPKQNSSRITKFLITLLLATIFPVIIFLIFLGILNYFNVIALNSASPVTKNLPKSPPSGPKYNVDAKTWTVKGTLSQYNNEKIKVKVGIINTMDLTYNSDSIFLKSDKSNETQLGTLYDLDQKANLNKNVEVEYKTVNKINYINKIMVYN